MFPFPHTSFGRSDIGLAQPIGVGLKEPYYNTSSNVVLPPGAMPGDLLVFNAPPGTNVTGGSSAVTTLGMLRFRRLVAADLDPNVMQMIGSVLCWALYRGVYSVVAKGSGSAVGQVNLAGFTKSSKCAGILALSRAAAPIGNPPIATAPLIDRIDSHANDSAAAVIHDLLDHRTYVNGTSLRVTGSTGFERITYAELFEMVF